MQQTIPAKTSSQIRLLISASAMAASVLPGCASPLDDRPFADWIDHNPASWQLTREGAVHTQNQPSGPARGETISPGAGAEDYVRLALKRNPAIRAAEQKVHRLAERIPQVTSLDDPMLQVAPVGEQAETAAGQVSVQTGLSQKLPFPGKLATRGRIAKQAVAMAKQDLRQKRLSIVADTRRAYWSYYNAVRSIEVTRQSRELLTQFRDIATAKYKTGTASQQDVLRASTDLSNLENDLLTLEQRQQTVAAMLNQLLDRPIGSKLPTPKPATISTTNLLLNRLLAEAAKHNPQLGKARDQIEAFRQRLKLARLNYWPDLTLNGHYNLVDDEGMAPGANGKDQWFVGFGINLPIWWGKLKAGKQEAFHGIAQGVADLTAAQNQVAFEVQDALTRVQTQQRSVLLLKNVILPQAQQTVDVSASGYQAGQVDFLTLITNWRKLLDFKLLYYQSSSQYEQDLADLQRVIGHDLPSQNLSPDVPENNSSRRRTSPQTFKSDRNITPLTTNNNAHHEAE